MVLFVRPAAPFAEPLRKLLALFVLVAASPGAATTLIQWDPIELARHSSAVVQGRVLRVGTRFSADGMRILTDVDMRVDAIWRGSTQAEIRITQFGGVMEGLAQRVDGMAEFSPGEEVVVFLEAAGDQYRLTGMAQGKFRIDRSHGVDVVPESLRDVLLVDAKTQRPAPSSVKTKRMSLELLRTYVKAAGPGQP